jgi:acyl-CoA synthetase (AMP-forming)/AMP-acid ligase II
MHLGLMRGDRLAVQSWNRSEMIEIEVACYKAGIVRVPMNAHLSPSESVHVLNDSETKAVIADPMHMDHILQHKSSIPKIEYLICLENTPAGVLDYEKTIAQSSVEMLDIDLDPSELAVLAYSSGTTGKMKAVMQSFANRLAMIRKALMIPGLSIEPGDVFVHAGPISHASGMWSMPMMFRGGCNLVLERFNVEKFLEAVQEEKASLTLLVPTMIHMLLDFPESRNYDLSSLKRVFYGAAPISKTRLRQAIDELFGSILIQGYGMTETTSAITILTSKDHLDALREDHQDRLASCGRPCFDTEVKVVDEAGGEVSTGEIGEIIARGPDVMVGYYKDAELTKATIRGGWVHTGDMARVDDEGYIYIVDRKSETIISGGFNVYPSEVEGVLYAHPAVFEACVVGVPDEKWGEAVKAVVVVKKGCVVTEQALMDHCKAFLAGYKKPQSIDFVNDLPKNPSGKIPRRVVREKYWRDRDRKLI